MSAPPMFCMWCNTPFHNGQAQCGCAIMKAAHDVDRRMTADRLLDQRITALEQRVRVLEGNVCHAKPADTPTPPTSEVRQPVLSRDECGTVYKWGESVQAPHTPGNP